MTETAAAPVRSNLSREVITVVSVLALVAIALPLWGWRSAEAATHVQVVAGPGPATCSGDDLPMRAADEDGEPAIIFRLEAKRGTSCQVPISIVNDSRHTITIRDLTFPAMHGSKGDNHGALLVTDDGSGGAPHGSGDSNTAVFDVDEQVEPGESWATLIRVEINPYACQSSGVWGVPDVPRVRFSVLHREHDTSGAIAFQANVRSPGLTWSGCASS